MGKWTCKNKNWFNVFGSLVYIFNEIQFYKVKKKLKPVEFCWLFLQEMRMGNIPCWAKVLLLMFYLIGNLTLKNSTLCQVQPVSLKNLMVIQVWKNLNPCLIGCPSRGWVAILEFEEYRVCLF